MANAKVTVKPMLAAKTEPPDGQAPKGIIYPVMCSPKMDGIRAFEEDGVLLSRTRKPIPSPKAQKFARVVPPGTDGELIVGMPNEDPYRRTESAVMKRQGSAAELNYFVFDNYLLPGGFQYRYAHLESIKFPLNVFLVPHVVAHSAEQLLQLEQRFLEEGFEGIMIRSLDGPYKFNRSTLNEGYLLKLKRFKDGEAVVTGTYERMHNANEAGTNELGRTERSSAKAGMQPTGMLGGFHVRGINEGFEGVEFDVSTSKMPKIELPDMWRRRTSYNGRILTYKYFPTGSKDKPRFPVFKGWRSKDDIS